MNAASGSQLWSKKDISGTISSLQVSLAGGRSTVEMIVVNGE